MDVDEDIWNLFKDLKVTRAEDVSSEVSTCEGGGSGSASNGTEQNKQICDFCNGDDFMLEDGNYICKTCDSIAERFIDMTAEWRYYGAEDNKGSDPTRCGMPVNELLPDSSLGTIISNKYGESNNMRLIRKYHMWNSMSYKERTLYNIFDNITLNAINNGIPASIIEEAKMFYKKVTESKIMRGENRSGLIATSIYMSCKAHKVPRSAKEIAKIFNLKLTTMTKSCKKFQDLLKMNMDSSSPNDFVMRFSSKLGLTSEIKDLCRYIVSKADELGIVSENTPPSISAAAIYMCNMVCSLGMSKTEISKNCDISQVTLCKCYKKLYNYRALLFPQEAIHKYNIK